MNDDDDDDDGDDDEEDDQEDIQSSLNNISFGALAKAQSSMPSRKTKHAKSSTAEDADTHPANPLDDIRARIREAREQKQSSLSSKSSKKDLEKRSSKHAPMVQSTKRAVTRRRTIIEPPATARSRDPRFDPTVVGKNTHMSVDSSEKAYGFLNEYRAKELKDLKDQMAKTKDPFQKERLKNQVRSATDKLREIENRKREQKVLADHKRKEKELIKEGKKSNPYYMKKSELKKEVIMRKYNEMNSKDRTKALERRRKKVASKEIKEMPMERRGFEGGPPPSRKGGGMKRKRAA